MEQESQELAQDIKENELINPPVVIPEQDGTFTLLAGERRLKAMKQLGYQQVEVRAWKTLTDEEKLNIEISENAVRKPFSWSENIEAANRLLQVKSADARRRQESTRFGVATTESFLTDGTVNPISAMFLLKSQHGYRDTITLEQQTSDADGLMAALPSKEDIIKCLPRYSEIDDDPEPPR